MVTSVVDGAIGSCTPHYATVRRSDAARVLAFEPIAFVAAPMSAPPPASQPPSQSDSPSAPRKATLGQVITAVFWSFFGIRKGKAMERDAVTIKPLHVIVVGVVLAAMFVLTLLLLVRVILANA